MKSTESGWVRLRVHGEHGSPPDIYRLVLEVSDSGAGIAPQAQRRVFESFTQLLSHADQRLGGTGLELAIARRLVDLMGGELSLHSQPGEGTVFRVEIPAECVDGGTPAEAPELQASGTVLFQPARLLLAESERYSRDVIRELLRDQPLEITEVDNGEQALLRCRLQAPDLVLMDMRLPVMGTYSDRQPRHFIVISDLMSRRSSPRQP